MSLLHQDLKNYKEFSSQEERIIRRHISFSLSDMVFNDQSIEGNLAASGIITPSSKEHHYRSGCASFNTDVWYNKDPKNITDDVEERYKLAYDVASEHMQAKYDGARILELKVSDVSVRFGGGKNLIKYFALDLAADVVLEEMVTAHEEKEE